MKTRIPDPYASVVYAHEGVESDTAIRVLVGTTGNETVFMEIGEHVQAQVVRMSPVIAAKIARSLAQAAHIAEHPDD